MKKQVSITLIVIMILATALSSTADKLSDTKRQRENINSKINSISKQKKQEQSKLRSAIDEKKYITEVQNTKSTEYQELIAEKENLEKEIEEIQNSIDETLENYKKQEELFKTRLKVMYENASYGKTNTILKSKNITDFFARLKYMQAISKKDKELIEEIKRAKSDIEYKKSLKEKMKLDKESMIGKKKKQIESLKASRADLENEIREINDKLEKLDEQEDELIKKSKELESQIRSLQRKVKYIGGNMIWPAPSSHSITSYYGNRFHPVLKKYKMHTGIDIGASSGSSIVAANKGVVIVAGWQSGYGNTVIIDHGGGIATLYAHCSKLLVSTGQSVDAGAVIAKVGSTGLSTGPHLHFEVRRNGATVNPLQYAR
ncbi:MAG TPA: peptidoglycan DD-metalloendopeptidase family protein [Pseudobacteroides sp.]|uniref:murein hydrolase activator EnvC family protein n=1 Tax=Pseudobacteroides sp. TaxID=1968840 RepID=UPI002F928A8C